MDAQSLVATIRPVVAAEADVEVAGLFGSGARDRSRADSDVDIYVRLCRGVRWSPARSQQLSEALARTVGREVDLVIEDRNSTSTVLRMEVARHGILIFERSPGGWTSLRANAMVDYADLEPFMRRVGEGIRRRVRERASG